MPPQRAGIAAFWCETWQRDLTRPENRQIAGDLEGGLVPLPTAGPISREVFSLSFLLDAAERRIYPPWFAHSWLCVCDPHWQLPLLQTAQVKFGGGGRRLARTS
jgi:hypothetical protein